MSKIRLNNMLAAYGRRVVFRRNPSLASDHRIMRRTNRTDIVEYNPKASISMNHAKASGVSVLLAEQAGYGYMRYAGFSIVPAFAQSLRDAGHWEGDDALLEYKMRAFVSDSVERASALLLRVVANNFKAQFGFDVPREYYKAGDPASLARCIDNAREAPIKASTTLDKLEFPYLKRLAMHRALIFLAENYLYQDEGTRRVAEKYMGEGLKEELFELLESADLMVPRDVLLSQEFLRTHYTRDRYQEAIKRTHAFFGSGEAFTLQLVDRGDYDRFLASKVTNLLENYKGIDDLLYALDMCLYAAPEKIRYQMNEAFDLCREVARTKILKNDSADERPVLMVLIERSRTLGNVRADSFLRGALSALNKRKHRPNKA